MTRSKTNCSRRVFFEWTTAEFTGTWRSLVMTAPQNSAAVTDVTFHSTYRKGYQSKLLFFHLKGGRCSFWGLLYCDDRRSWVTSCNQIDQFCELCLRVKGWTVKNRCRFKGIDFLRVSKIFLLTLAMLENKMGLWNSLCFPSRKAVGTIFSRWRTIVVVHHRHWPSLKNLIEFLRILF